MWIAASHSRESGFQTKANSNISCTISIELAIHYLQINSETNFLVKKCDLAKLIYEQQTVVYTLFIFRHLIWCNVASKSSVFFDEYSLWVSSRNCPIAKMANTCDKNRFTEITNNVYTLFMFSWHFDGVLSLFANKV